MLFSHKSCAQNEPNQASEPRERQEAAGVPRNILQDAGSTATDHDLQQELRYFLNSYPLVFLSLEFSMVSMSYGIYSNNGMFQDAMSAKLQK